MMYVKEQLGHSSINVTVDIYGHLIPDGNKEAVDRLDDNNDIRYIPEDGCQEELKINQREN